MLFDDEVEVIHDRVPIEKVAPLTGREYFTRGCTALLDAIGDSIQHIRNIHKYAREEDRPVRTMFVITTDGLENSSVHYTAKKIKKLIGHQEEKHGWEFVFLGANMDAVAVAGDLGIRRENSVEFACDAGGVRENFASLSAMTCGFIKTGVVGAGWSGAIADYCRKKRGKKCDACCE